MKLLFAVDLSEPPSVTAQVERLAQRLEATLLILHVRTPAPTAPVAPVDPMSGLMGFAPYSMYDPTLEQNLEKAEEDAFHAFLVGRFSASVHAGIREGDPAETILDDAREENADIIILGKRHQTKLERLLAGSVADEVIRHAQVPVILIPVLEESSVRLRV